MNNLTKLISISLIVAAAGSAYAETNDKVNKEVKFQAKEGGGYESSAVTETTTDQGTKQVVKTTEDVDVNGGHIVGKLEKDTRTNPKGLLNETYKKEQARNEINPDGSAELEARSVSVDNKGTSVDSKLKTTSKINDSGVVKTTSNLKTTVDPKGMMNKSVIETNQVTDKKADGSTTTHTEKKIDGKIVEQKVE